MSQADQAAPAAPTTPGEEKQPLQALVKALLDEERLRLLGLLAQRGCLRQRGRHPETTTN